MLLLEDKSIKLATLAQWNYLLHLALLLLCDIFNILILFKIEIFFFSTVSITGKNSPNRVDQTD